MQLPNSLNYLFGVQQVGYSFTVRHRGNHILLCEIINIFTLENLISSTYNLRAICTTGFSKNLLIETWGTMYSGLNVVCPGMSSIEMTLDTNRNTTSTFSVGRYLGKNL